MHVPFLQEGAGRRIGEQTEQLWSLIKPFCKIARYMTKAHWYDAFNSALWALTLRKQRTAPAMLEGRVKRNKDHLGELMGGMQPNVALASYSIIMSSAAPCPSCCPSAEACLAKLDELLAEASAAHHRKWTMQDMDDAVARLVEHENNPLEQADAVEQYVEAREKLRSMQVIQDEGGALLLVAPGNAGIHLNQQGACAKNWRRARDKVIALSTTLNIPPGEPWARDSPQYKAGLEKVHQRKILHFQELVESQVFKRKLILKGLERVESGKNGSKHHKRLAAASG